MQANHVEHRKSLVPEVAAAAGAGAGRAGRRCAEARQSGAARRMSPRALRLRVARRCARTSSCPRGASARPHGRVRSRSLAGGGPRAVARAGAGAGSEAGSGSDTAAAAGAAAPTGVEALLCGSGPAVGSELHMHRHA